MLTLNLLLAIVWVLLTGDISLGNLLGAFIVSYGVLWLLKDVLGTRLSGQYFVKSSLLLRLIPYVLWTIVLANLRMALVVLSPLDKLKPAIVSIPLELRHPAGVTLLANWITLTPGTLSLDVSAERTHLLVHTFDRGQGVNTFRRTIKEEYEARLIPLFDNPQFNGSVEV